MAPSPAASVFTAASRKVRSRNAVEARPTCQPSRPGKASAILWEAGGRMDSVGAWADNGDVATPVAISDNLIALFFRNLDGAYDATPVPYYEAECYQGLLTKSSVNDF